MKTLQIVFTLSRNLMMSMTFIFVSESLMLILFVHAFPCKSADIRNFFWISFS